MAAATRSGLDFGRAQLNEEFFSFEMGRTCQTQLRSKRERENKKLGFGFHSDVSLCPQSIKKGINCGCKERLTRSQDGQFLKLTSVARATGPGASVIKYFEESKMFN